MKVSTTEIAVDTEVKPLASSVVESSGFWSTIRESLSGSRRDYTEGDIGRAILLLAIPMVLELSLESVFAVVDVFFVARLGADAVATVGLTESMLTIIYAMAIGLSVGATATGRGIGVLFQLYWLWRGEGRVGIRREHVRLDPTVMLNMVRLSGSAVLQALVNTTSYVGLVRIISSFGSAALAGYTIAIRMVIFAMLPSWGLSNAAATLVGQNLGAGKPDRAEISVWRTAFYNTLFLAVVGALFIAFAPALVSVFTADPAVAPYGVRCL